MASVPVGAAPSKNSRGAEGRFGTSRIEMSASGSYETTKASYVCPSTSTVTLSEPATTCALDITRLGATTKPLPSKTFWQLEAIPRIFTTLGRVAATTASLASDASGGSTGTIGVRLVRALQRGGQHPGGQHHGDQLQSDADHRIDGAQCAVADGATHSAAQH